MVVVNQFGLCIQDQHTPVFCCILYGGPYSVSYMTAHGMGDYNGHAWARALISYLAWTSDLAPASAVNLEFLALGSAPRARGERIFSFI